MHFVARCLMSIAALAASSLAWAQVPPPPTGPDVHFRDADPAARVIFGKAASDAGRSRIEQHVINYPLDSRGWSALAFARSLQGDTDGFEQALQTAQQLSQNNVFSRRRVAWSEGWSRLNLGHVPEAVSAWTQAFQLHGGRPYWIPYSLAVTAELSGERDVALAWYTQAAKDFPERWDERSGVLRMTGHWQPSERAAMLRLFAAWQHERARLLASP